MLRRLWNYLTFGVRQVLVFGKHVVYVLVIVCTIIAIVDSFSKGPRSNLEKNLNYAIENSWVNGEVLDVHFSVDKAIMFRQEQIEGLTRRIVGDYNIVVDDELQRGRRGYKLRNDIPLHLVRAFYTEGEAGKGPTVWLVSDNVTDIPEWLLKHEIVIPLN